MAVAFHKDQSPTEGIHVIHHWDVASAAARNALVVAPADIGRVARQQSDGSFWVLVNDVGSVWSALATGGAAPVFGNEFAVASSLAVTTMTSVTFLSKVLLAVPAVVGGQYRLGVSYGWNHNGVTSDFESRIMVNAVQQGDIHKQEPKDAAGADPTGTTQRHYASRTVYLTLAAGAIPSIDLQFRTDLAGTSSSIWEATLEFWRVS